MDVKNLNKSLRQATAELREFSRALDSLTRFVAGDAAAQLRKSLKNTQQILEDNRNTARAITASQKLSKNREKDGE